MPNQKKVALVTGASSGMGKEHVKALIKEGYIVYAVARRLDKMSDIAELGACTLQMDITQQTDIEAVVNKIKDAEGRVDVLINNAGFGLYGSVEETSIDDARYQFEVNIFGLAALTQQIIPLMRQQKSGKIINISSMGGRIYTPLGAWYHATKHALEGWSDCLRIELQQFGIDVVVIQPGAIVTEFGDVVSAPILARSGSGPYADIANKLVSAIKTSYEKGEGSPPKVIVDLIIKAVRARKPKTRYAAGQYAKPLMFVRKWFGDRVFDKAVMGMVK